MSVRLRVLATQAHLSYRSVFPWSDPASYVANVILRPVFTVAILALAGEFALGKQVARDYAIGGATFAASWTLTGSIVQGFWVERAGATLPALFVSTGSRLQMFVARGLLHLPNGAVTVLMTLLASLVFVGAAFQDADWPAVVLCFIALLISIMTFGLCVGIFAIALREWIVVRAAGQMLLMSFTGAFVPLADLPRGLELLGTILPLTHGLEGLRKAIDGASTGVVLGPAGLEAVIGVFYLVVGYLSFIGLEMLATRKGTYDRI